MSGLKLDHVWSKTKFIAFIRTRFPQAAEYHLASLTGIPATTCKKHINGETKPSADHLLAYLALFGPELLCAVMGDNAPRWAARGRHEQLYRQLKQQAAQANQRLAQYQMG